jgi:thiol:disulfide interchange protein DsbA
MKVLFFLAAMLMIPMVHAAPQFKEGVNYDVVSQTGSAQPEVMEFFSISARTAPSSSRLPRI